jgi:hypothetical protein
MANISKSQSNYLYKLIKFVHDILIKNKISYWVTGGSLLGAVRHHGVIPWDDDGDICVMKKDVNKLRDLIDKFKKGGYLLEEGNESDEDEDEDEDEEEKSCKEKNNSCTWFVERCDGKGLGLDIFVMDKIGNIITYADPTWRCASNGGKTCYFFFDHVFPLIPIKFGNFFVMSPNNPIEHLNLCYGSDWNTMAQRLYDHREGKWINSKKRRMLPSDYRTIPPPTETHDDKVPVNIKADLNFRNENWELISTRELKFFAKSLHIENYTKLTRTELINKIKNI